MAWTKRKIIELAFEEIGLAPHVFDLTPEQYQSALHRLDAMVAGWNATTVRIAYPIPTDPSRSDLDDVLTVPDFSIEAMYTNLAVRMAPSFGKAVSPETRSTAVMAFNNMADQSASQTPEIGYPNTLPLGAGAKSFRNYNDPFVAVTPERLLAGSDNPIDFE